MLPFGFERYVPAGRLFNALIRHCFWAIACGLPRSNKHTVMDVEETQVSVKFVTKLPDQLRVPEEVLVSIVEHRKKTPTLCP